MRSKNECCLDSWWKPSSPLEGLAHHQMARAGPWSVATSAFSAAGPLPHPTTLQLHLGPRAAIRNGTLHFSIICALGYMHLQRPKYCHRSTFVAYKSAKHNPQMRFRKESHASLIWILLQVYRWSFLSLFNILTPPPKQSNLNNYLLPMSNHLCL